MLSLISLFSFCLFYIFTSAQIFNVNNNNNLVLPNSFPHTQGLEIYFQIL